MLQVDMSASVRRTFGKGAARSLRRRGLTPAVLYGPKTDALALELETLPFTKALLNIHRQNAVINLAVVDGDKNIQKHVMIKELQTNPIQDSLVHADLYEISLDAPLELHVPLKVTGKAKGIDMGGELHVLMPTVLVRGLVMDVPDFLEIDVTPLEIGDKITCNSLNIPSNITLLDDESAVCLSVQEISVSAAMMEEEPEVEAEAEEETSEGAEGAKAEESTEAPAAE